MPYFREEDNKRKQNSWRQEAHDVLVLAIQTIDTLPYVQGPSNAVQKETYEEQLRELRQRLDLILNSNHWKEKVFMELLKMKNGNVNLQYSGNMKVVGQSVMETGNSFAR